MIDICPPRMLTVAEVAKSLRVSRSRVYELIDGRQIAHHRIGGPRGAIRITEADLQVFLTESRVEQTADALPPPPPSRRTDLKHIRL